ncbi:MAG: hypothetical protein V7641_3285 [Blastocatellia bacterium]
MMVQSVPLVTPVLGAIGALANGVTSETKKQEAK